MIRLMHSYFSEPITFIENKINVLVVENPLIFTKMIKQLLQQKEGFESEFIFSLDYNVIELHNNIEVITDIFNLEINNKKITNKIYNFLKDISNTEMLQDTRNLSCEVINFLKKLVQHIDYPLTYDLDIDISSVFKICNLKVETDSEDILEQIVNYMILNRNLFNIKLFIFINLKTLLSKEQILNLYKLVCYEKINILLLENSIKDVLLYEKIKIIDNDICEIY